VAVDARKRADAARRMFPPRSFDYVPENEYEGAEAVTIDVSPFPASELSKLGDSVTRLAQLYYVDGRSLAEVVGLAAKDVVNVLRPIVRVRDEPDLTVDDLPADALSGCLELVLESISPGKWKSLGRKFQDVFGIETVPVGAVEMAAARATAEAAANVGA